jgi:nucleoside-diphosphate-sugar epimerase
LRDKRREDEYGKALSAFSNQIAGDDLISSALVTGAYGFVGVHLCRALVKQHWRVVAGHRENSPRMAIPGVIPAYLPLCAQPADWHRSLRSVECVVHLAGYVHRFGRQQHDIYEQINVGGSRFVAEQAARAGVKRFVFLSSAKVNGEGAGARPYRAEDPPEPHDSYARSKASAESVIRDICSRTGIEFAIVRPPLVYGPGVRANFKRLLRLAELGCPLPLGSIDNRRSLVGVGNLVDFLMTCMQHPRSGGRVWLVNDGEDISTPDLITRMAVLMRRRTRLFPCPPTVLKTLAMLIGRGAEASRLCDSFLVDARPALDMLRWTPPMSVDEELARTTADYMEQRA